MNNKGQTLVFFVILIPLVLIIFAFIFDYSYMIREQNRLEDIGRSGLNYLLIESRNKDEVLKVIKENDSDIDVKFNGLNEVFLEKEIDSIFGKIIGFDNYKIKVSLKGEVNDNKLIIEEGN